MAFTALTSAACAAGKAVTTTLMNLIRTNFDDHESRIAAVEAVTIDTGYIVGEVRIWTTNTLPTGWLFCDGSAVSRTVTYDDLYAVIGTTYGVGDGSTTYNLPDLRGRVPFGQDDMDNSVGTGGGAASRLTASATGGINGSALGNSGGEQAHTLTGGETGTNTHTHSLSNTNHTHAPGGGRSYHVVSNQTGTGSSGVGLVIPNTANSDCLYEGATANPTWSPSPTAAANSNADASSAHNTVPPGLVINYIIRYLA